MSTFVLVHGSWHGAWCWYKVIPLLEAAGHRVVALDLPGLGTSKITPAQVTLDMWIDHVCDELDRHAQPVVLVGHSRGGLLISGAAERRPDKISRLIYLTAFLLPDGGTMLGAAAEDGDSKAGDFLEVNEAEGFITFDNRELQHVFYAQCDEQDVALARLCIQPEPLAPLATPLQLSDEHFGRVPRVYIECLQDRAISPAKQKAMYSELPCEAVISMDTDHSPFFSATPALVGHLLEWA